MITKEDYLLMKKLIEDYENKVLPDPKSPYIVSYFITKHIQYNPYFGDNRECICGHSYYRHFDSYEGMDACGCKYCACDYFELSQVELRDDKLNELL
jgi:hypothetical protein